MPDLDSKRDVLLLIVAVLVAICLVGWIAWQFLAGPTYHAVSLTSGELYFGQLEKFPKFGLKNVYTLQVTQNQEQPFSVQRFDSAFWGPENFLKLNKENVVWMAELSSQSQLLQVIRENPNLIPQQAPQGGQAVPGGQQDVQQAPQEPVQ